MTAEERLSAKIKEDLGAKDILILQLAVRAEMLAEQLAEAQARIARLEQATNMQQAAE